MVQCSECGCPNSPGPGLGLPRNENRMQNVQNWLSNLPPQNQIGDLEILNSTLGSSFNSGPSGGACARSPGNYSNNAASSLGGQMGGVNRGLEGVQMPSFSSSSGSSYGGGGGGGAGAAAYEPCQRPQTPIQQQQPLRPDLSPISRAQAIAFGDSPESLNIPPIGPPPQNNYRPSADAGRPQFNSTFDESIGSGVISVPDYQMPNFDSSSSSGGSGAGGGAVGGAFGGAVGGAFGGAVGGAFGGAGDGGACQRMNTSGASGGINNVGPPSFNSSISSYMGQGQPQRPPTPCQMPNANQGAPPCGGDFNISGMSGAGLGDMNQPSFNSSRSSGARQDNQSYSCGQVSLMGTPNGNVCGRCGSVGGTPPFRSPQQLMPATPRMTMGGGLGGIDNIGAPSFESSYSSYPGSPGAGNQPQRPATPCQMPNIPPPPGIVPLAAGDNGGGGLGVMPVGAPNFNSTFNDNWQPLPPNANLGNNLNISGISGGGLGDMNQPSFGSSSSGSSYAPPRPANLCGDNLNFSSGASGGGLSNVSAASYNSSFSQPQSRPATPCGMPNPQANNALAESFGAQSSGLSSGRQRVVDMGDISRALANIPEPPPCPRQVNTSNASFEPPRPANLCGENLNMSGGQGCGGIGDVMQPSFSGSSSAGSNVCGRNLNMSGMSGAGLGDMNQPSFNSSSGGSYSCGQVSLMGTPNGNVCGRDGIVPGTPPFRSPQQPMASTPIMTMGGGLGGIDRIQPPSFNSSSSSDQSSVFQPPPPNVNLGNNLNMSGMSGGGCGLQNMSAPSFNSSDASYHPPQVGSPLGGNLNMSGLSNAGYLADVSQPSSLGSSIGPVCGDNLNMSGNQGAGLGDMTPPSFNSSGSSGGFGPPMFNSTALGAPAGPAPNSNYAGALQVINRPENAGMVQFARQNPQLALALAVGRNAQGVVSTPSGNCDGRDVPSRQSLMYLSALLHRILQERCPCPPHHPNYRPCRDRTLRGLQTVIAMMANGFGGGGYPGGFGGGFGPGGFGGGPGGPGGGYPQIMGRGQFPALPAPPCPRPQNNNGDVQGLANVLGAIPEPCPCPRRAQGQQDDGGTCGRGQGGGAQGRQENFPPPTAGTMSDGIGGPKIKSFLGKTGNQASLDGVGGRKCKGLED